MLSFRIPKHSDSFFSKNDEKINDIDDNIVTVEVLNENKSPYDSYTQVARLFVFLYQKVLNNFHFVFREMGKANLYHKYFKHN